jgi:hypothetical protein
MKPIFDTSLVQIDVTREPEIKGTIPLCDAIGECFIIAHNEDTLQLEGVMRSEGLPFKILRQVDLPCYQNYASIYRCMLNHQNAWEKAALLEKPTLIVEADFVPVNAFSRYPCPFEQENENFGIAWLYTTAPELYEVHKKRYAVGYSSSLVAYVLSKKAAHCLCEYADQVTQNYGTVYSNFDRYIGSYLNKLNYVNYIPYRNYGEHGGTPNPEHRKNGQKSVHHADILFGKLAFYPLYAGSSRYRCVKFIIGRIYGRTKGIGRLLAGLYLPYTKLRDVNSVLRMLMFAAGRYFFKF